MHIMSSEKVSAMRMAEPNRIPSARDGHHGDATRYRDTCCDAGFLAGACIQQTIGHSFFPHVGGQASGRVGSVKRSAATFLIS